MNDILIAIIWWFVWWLISLILHYYNLKKESFFRLQEKWEILLMALYKYQDNLCKIDLQSDDLKDNENIKTNEELETFLQKSNDLWLFQTAHQELRDKIWSLIMLYFPELENDFRSYTMIEINHKSEHEYEITTMNQRENKISEISIKIYNLVNSQRRIFLWFKF